MSSDGSLDDYVRIDTPSALSREQAVAVHLSQVDHETLH